MGALTLAVRRPAGRARRPLLAVGTAAVVVLAVVWWLAWMVPEGSRLAAVRAQQSMDRSTRAAITAELAQLRHEARRSASAARYLERFSAAIPSTPEAAKLVVQVAALAAKDGVSLQSITDNSRTDTGAGYSTIPVTLSVAGPHAALLRFVGGLYQLPRLLTVQTLGLDGATGAGSATGVATIAATAYTTATGAAPAGG